MRNKLILEFTEFNLQRLNSDSSVMATHVDNPALSLNSFDKHEEIIKGAIMRLKDLSGGNAHLYRNIKSNLLLDEQRVDKLSILKIINKNGVNYDIYITFMINDIEYWGVILDFLTNPQFKTEALKDGENLYLTREWVIRLKGLIINSIKDFLKPEKGEWKSLKDGILCYSNTTGSILNIDIGTTINVVKSYDDRIIFDKSGDKYTLRGDNFIYFKWWFEKV
jgi:hypothetical protein